MAGARSSGAPASGAGALFRRDAGAGLCFFGGICGGVQLNVCGFPPGNGRLSGLRLKSRKFVRGCFCVAWINSLFCFVGALRVILAR